MYKGGCAKNSLKDRIILIYTQIQVGKIFPIVKQHFSVEIINRHNYKVN